MKDHEIKQVLKESWTTLADVCEFHDDSSYSLDVEAVRRLLEKIHAGMKSLDDRLGGKVMIPQKSGGNRPGY
jgi:hypothetical protein